MDLTIVTPTGVLLEEQVSQVKAEGVEGYFTVFPHHADYSMTLKPSILFYESNKPAEKGVKKFIAIDEGVLVKCLDHLRISTFRAVAGSDLTELKEYTETTFHALDSQEKEARAIVNKFQARIAKLLFALQEEA